MSWFDILLPRGTASFAPSRNETVRHVEKTAVEVETRKANIIPDEIKRLQVSMIVRHVMSMRARSNLFASPRRW